MLKNLKYGLNTFITVILVLAALSIIAIFSMDHHKRFDMTANKKFTLDDKSIKITESLNQDIEVIVFFGKGSSFEQKSKDLLTQYEYYTKKFKVQYLETNKNPESAKEMGIESVDSMVLKTEKHKEIITSLTEENFTNALIKVTLEAEVKIAFVVGHGERSFTGTEQDSFSMAGDALKKESYQLTEVNLSSGDIPGDVNLVVIAGPKVSYTEGEIQRLENYLKNGGALMVLIGPRYENKMLVAFLKEYGIKMDYEVVLDTLGNNVFRNPYMVIVPLGYYGTHPIVNGFKMNTNFFYTRPIQLEKELPQGVAFSELAKSSPQPMSWAIEPKQKLTKEDLEFTPGKKGGPFIIGVAGEIQLKNDPGKTDKDEKNKRNTARMVVFGNANFPSNDFLNIQGNRLLFKNCVAWLTEQDRISISEPSAPFAPLSLEEPQKKKIFTITVLIMPFVILLAGVFMLWTRK